jgi:hypothetical protein
MSENRYPPGGVLFQNRRKTQQNHPDMTGSLEISGDLLTELVNAANNGQPIKMDISAWTKSDKNGNKFLSLTARKPFVPQQQASGGGWGNRQQAQPAQQRPQQHQNLPPIEDEIPF